MAKDRKDHSDRRVSEAKSKLSRLLETENQLETMLKEARRDAESLVEAARAAAEARVRQFELQLEDENREIGERIARDRDQAIDAVNTEAEEESTRLDAIDDTQITTLARYVVDLVVGRSETGGPR
jgi:F0F1-type ATP synthase membrane subunit b/b'